MIASVLVPSRSNPAGLQQLVFSLLMSAPPRSFEVLVELDDCDPILGSYEKLPLGDASVRVFVTQRGDGYRGLHKKYTHLAEQSSAPWVWPMDDDAYVLGSGWAEQLARVPRSGYVAYAEWYLLGSSRYRHAEGCFPVVPNGCWRKLGHDEMGHPVDRWLDENLRVVAGWETIYMSGISVQHDGRPR
jgi:hypothetical protein